MQQSDVYAPFGDDPLLLHDVDDHATGRDAHAQRLVVRVLGGEPVRPDDGPSRSRRARSRAGTPAHDDAVAPRRRRGDGDERAARRSSPPRCAGPLDGYETSVATFFGGGLARRARGGRGRPPANGLAPASIAATPSGTLFAFRAPLHARARREHARLRYAFGMAHGEQVARARRQVSRAPPIRSPRARRRWARWVPKADFGAGNAWVARELQWDAYLLRSASVYEEVCGHHTITQGGYYQYVDRR